MQVTLTHEDIIIMAINFQINSPLAKELELIYTKGQAYAKSLNIRTKKDAEKVREYFKLELVPILGATIKKNTGIIITEVRVSKSPDLMYAIMPKLNSLKNTAAVMQRSYALGAKQNIAPKTADELNKIYEGFNKETGKIEITGTELEVSAIFFFDPYSAFMPKETIYKSVDELSPQEITAITLHEIGHVLALVERAADTTYRIAQFQDSFTSFCKSAPEDEQLKALTTIGQKVNSAEDAIMQEKLIEKYESFRIAMSNNKSVQYFGSVGLTIVSAAMLIMYPIVFAFNFFDRTLTEKVIDVVVNNPKYKNSDIRGSLNNYTRIERYADEYCSRFGYGAQLITSLKHIRSQAICCISGNGDPIEARRMSKIAYGMAQFFLGVVQPLYYGVSFDIHKSDEERAEHAIQDLNVFFKQPSLPASVVDFYLSELSAAKIALKEARHIGKFSYVVKAAFEFVVYLIGPMSIWDMLINGRITREVDRLHKLIDGFTNNELYAYAEQFKRLTK